MVKNHLEIFHYKEGNGKEAQKIPHAWFIKSTNSFGSLDAGEPFLEPGII